MNDSDDPKNPELDSLEKHIKLNWDEASPSKVSPDSAAAPPSFEVSPVKQFYRDLFDCLTEPKFFFTERFPKTSLSYAFAFGIIVNWIAAFLSWIIREVKHETLLDGFMRMRDKLQQLPVWRSLPDNFWAQGDHPSTPLFPSWLAEVMRIILSPFQSLVHFAISGLVLFIGAYLLIPKKQNIY
jgi:hypothetical protein